MSAESPTTPRDTYVFDLAQTRLERWTHSEIGPLDPAKLVTPELVKFPDLGPRQRPPAPAVGLGVPPGAAEGRGAGAHQHPRRAGVPGAARLGPVRAVPGQRARLRRDRAERARLLRLRQELPRPGQWRAARGCRARHRLAPGMGRRAAGLRPRPRGRDGRLLRRLHGAGRAGQLRRAAARRHRRRRHQRLRQLPAQHLRATGATCGAPSTATSATCTCASSSSASPR